MKILLLAKQALDVVFAIGLLFDGVSLNALLLLYNSMSAAGLSTLMLRLRSGFNPAMLSQTLTFLLGVLTLCIVTLKDKRAGVRLQSAAMAEHLSYFIVPLFRGPMLERVGCSTFDNNDLSVDWPNGTPGCETGAAVTSAGWCLRLVNLGFVMIGIGVAPSISNRVLVLSSAAQGAKLLLVVCLDLVKSNFEDLFDDVVEFPVDLFHVLGLSLFILVAALGVCVQTLLIARRKGLQTTHNFEPGKMGISYDENGFVKEVFDNGPAHTKDIKEGSRIVQIEDVEYSRVALAAAENSGKQYKVTFEVSSGKHQYRRNACCKCCKNLCLCLARGLRAVDSFIILAFIHPEELHPRRVCLRLRVWIKSKCMSARNKPKPFAIVPEESTNEESGNVMDPGKRDTEEDLASKTSDNQKGLASETQPPEENNSDAGNDSLHQSKPSVMTDCTDVTQMKVKIHGIDYDQLVSDPSLTNSVKTEIKGAVLEEAGNQIQESSVQVDLTKGSVVATIKIFEPTPDTLKASSSLTNSIATKVSEVPGIKAVTSGPIVASKEDSEAPVATPAIDAGEVENGAKQAASAGEESSGDKELEQATCAAEASVAQARTATVESTKDSVELDRLREDRENESPQSLRESGLEGRNSDVQDELIEGWCGEQHETPPSQPSQGVAPQRDLEDLALACEDSAEEVVQYPVATHGAVQPNNIQNPVPTVAEEALQEKPTSDVEEQPPRPPVQSPSSESVEEELTKESSTDACATPRAPHLADMLPGAAQEVEEDLFGESIADDGAVPMVATPQEKVPKAQKDEDILTEKENAKEACTHPMMAKSSQQIPDALQEVDEQATKQNVNDTCTTPAVPDPPPAGVSDAGLEAHQLSLLAERRQEPDVKKGTEPSNSSKPEAKKEDESKKEVPRHIKLSPLLDTKVLEKQEPQEETQGSRGVASSSDADQGCAKAFVIRKQKKR